MLYKLFRFFAFKFDPEFIHEMALFAFKNIPFLYCIFPGVGKCGSKYSLRTKHLRWNFPVGVAAGFDKEAEVIDFFGKLGFGAIEVGTVTPLPQPGNPKPRIFRLKSDRSLRNSMGFPNSGADKILKNISKSSRINDIVVGINIGKNKLTPDERAIDDYIYLYNYFYDQGDYLVVNISSPNTPGLRDMQREATLDNLLGALASERDKRGDKPLYLKISPDLSDDDIDMVVKTAIKHRLSGIVATNTTIIEDLGIGGVSGELLREKSRRVRNRVLQLASDVSDFDVIAAGGISTFDDVLEFWKGGGKFVQIYTSFIYKGPGILKDFKREIDHLLKKYNVDCLEDLLVKLSN